MLHRLAHLNEGRKMHHRVKAPCQDRVQQSAVTDIALNKVAAQHRIAMPRGQIVQRRHRAALTAQHLHHV